MQANTTNLEKQAINAALQNLWEDAITLNLQILDKSPNNIGAKVRLGRAYLQTENFSKAVKAFQEVLKIDPINPIAQKNLKMAKDHKVEKNKNVSITAKSLIKEPGTAIETSFEVTDKKFDPTKCVPGETFELKIKKGSVEVFYEEKLIGAILDKNLITDLYNSKEKRAQLQISFIRHKDKFVVILIKANFPVFRAEKQDVRPYFKKGTIEEPELEMEGEEEETEYPEE